jgi:hypothetical protein
MTNYDVILGYYDVIQDKLQSTFTIINIYMVFNRTYVVIDEYHMYMLLGMCYILCMCVYVCVGGYLLFLADFAIFS